MNLMLAIIKTKFSEAQQNSSSEVAVSKPAAAAGFNLRKFIKFKIYKSNKVQQRRMSKVEKDKILTQFQVQNPGDDDSEQGQLRIKIEKGDQTPKKPQLTRAQQRRMTITTNRRMKRTSVLNQVSRLNNRLAMMGTPGIKRPSRNESNSQSRQSQVEEPPNRNPSQFQQVQASPDQTGQSNNLMLGSGGSQFNTSGKKVSKSNFGFHQYIQQLQQQDERQSEILRNKNFKIPSLNLKRMQVLKVVQVEAEEGADEAAGGKKQKIKLVDVNKQIEELSSQRGKEDQLEKLQEDILQAEKIFISSSHLKTVEQLETLEQIDEILDNLEQSQEDSTQFRTAEKEQMQKIQAQCTDMNILSMKKLKFPPAATQKTTGKGTQTRVERQGSSLGNGQLSQKHSSSNSNRDNNNRKSIGRNVERPARGAEEGNTNKAGRGADNSKLSISSSGKSQDAGNSSVNSGRPKRKSGQPARNAGDQSESDSDESEFDINYPGVKEKDMLQDEDFVVELQHAPQLRQELRGDNDASREQMQERRRGRVGRLSKEMTRVQRRQFEGQKVFRNPYMSLMENDDEAEADYFRGIVRSEYLKVRVVFGGEFASHDDVLPSKQAQEQLNQLKREETLLRNIHYKIRYSFFNHKIDKLSSNVMLKKLRKELDKRQSTVLVNAGAAKRQEARKKRQKRLRHKKMKTYLQHYDKSLGKSKKAAMS